MASWASFAQRPTGTDQPLVALSHGVQSELVWLGAAARPHSVANLSVALGEGLGGAGGANMVEASPARKLVDSGALGELAAVATAVWLSILCEEKIEGE
jgi:hypothetical protein